MVLFSRNSDIGEITNRVEAMITRIVASQTSENHWVTHYGANYLHPRHLVFWICVQSDRERNRLQADSVLIARLRQTLVDANYPLEGREDVFIGFESQETVDRQSEGSWYNHWK